MSEEPPIAREDHQLAENEQWVDYVPQVAVPYLKQRNQAERERDGALQWLVDTETRLDTTAQKLEEALIDPVTDLPNRTVFNWEFEGLFHQSLPGELAVYYIDLTNLKPVNDNYGHEVGDAYLRAAANSLKDSVRPDDLVARLGGDEFAVAMKGNMTPEIVAEIQARFGDNFQSRAREANLPYGALGLAVGAAVKQTRDSISSILDKADQGSQAAKAELYRAAGIERRRDRAVN